MGMTTCRQLSLKMMMRSVSCAAASRVWIWSCLEPKIWDGKRSTRLARRRRERARHAHHGDAGHAPTRAQRVDRVLGPQRAKARPPRRRRRERARERGEEAHRCYFRERSHLRAAAVSRSVAAHQCSAWMQAAFVAGVFCKGYALEAALLQVPSLSRSRR